MQMLEADKSEGRSRQHGTSLLSVSTGDKSLGESLLSVFESSKDEASSVPLDIAQRVLARNAKSQPAFLQSGAAPSGGSYAPQSGQIFGILTTMKEEFEANLSEEQKAETKAAADFEAMAKAKSEQIETAKEKL